MEKINQAIERAKESRSPATQPNAPAYPPVAQPQFRADGFSVDASQLWGKHATLNAAVLEANRIVAHDIASPHAKSFDMLRTQVLQSMELKGWQTLGVTSPTEACGKTVTSINLALSIARQQDRSVLLVDADIQRPQVANYLGLKCNQGILSVLEGRTDLQSVLIQTRVKNQKMLVLPCEAASLGSSEWMASPSMTTLLQDIRRDFKGWTVIFDLPHPPGLRIRHDQAWQKNTDSGQRPMRSARRRAR